MKPTAWAVVFLTLSFIPVAARQTDTQQRRHKKSNVAGPNDSSQLKPRPAIVAACQDLETFSTSVDKLYDEEGNPVFDLVTTEGNHYGPPSADDPDLAWDNLIDCANQTQSDSERAEALRVSARWELWRAESFAKQQREARPVHPDSCDNLDQLRARVKAVTDEEPLSAISHPMQDYDLTLEALRKCMNESVRVSKGKPDERYWSAVTLLSLELWEARRARAFFERAYLNTTDYARAQAEHDARQKGGAEQNEKIRIDQPAGEAASQCDQIITVAGLTPNGLALYIPPLGQQFMSKNSRNYPRMCLVEETTAASFGTGVPHYLLVWAYSENAFAGFQPIQRVTTSPVSGAGTVTNFYGDRWNFTYSANLTEIDTVEAPYVVQSHSLFLQAYDQNGHVVSRHSITTSNMAGGDASYAAGYNASALITALWNNPSHLINSVLKDVQKDSTKYGRN